MITIIWFNMDMLLYSVPAKKSKNHTSAWYDRYNRVATSLRVASNKRH